MIKKRYITLLLTVAAVFSAAAQHTNAEGTDSGRQSVPNAEPSSQVVFFDGEVSTHFDNTEYTGCDCGTSRTIFAVRLSPSLGFRWNRHHSVVAGVEMLKDFGSDKFIDDAKLVAYYRFDNGRYGAAAGIFGRHNLIGRYSRAFYSDSTLIYNSLVQGIAMHYKGRRSFAEFAIDWTGLYSETTREQFRILVSGGGVFGKFFDAGVSFSLQHYANKKTFEGNVVDNLLLNPYIGARFTAFFDFDIRLSYLQSLQRDRRTEEGWKAPMGGELYFRISRWGVFIDNNLYVGKSLTPFWNALGKDGLPYADDLYTGDPFYGTEHRVYNRTGIGYERKFLKDNLSVRAEMVLQCNGSKLYYQQLVGVSARICPTIYDKSKHKR